MEASIQHEQTALTQMAAEFPATLFNRACCDRHLLLEQKPYKQQNVVTDMHCAVLL